jgi:hypothetical protein
MFLNVYDYAFASPFEHGWKTILAEYESIPADRLVHWPERAIYDFGWRAFPLVAFGQTISPNAAACPETMRLLKSIPTLVDAGFSLFEAGTHIHPHVGYTSSVFRFHLWFENTGSVRIARPGRGPALGRRKTPGI